MKFFIYIFSFLLAFNFSAFAGTGTVLEATTVKGIESVKNFIPDGEEPLDATGWTHGSYSAATRPSGSFTASSGAGKFVVSTTGTSPLDGKKSFIFTKASGANYQGRAAEYSFDLPLKYRAKVLSIDINYILNSGTFQAGSRDTDSSLIWYASFYDGTSWSVAEPSSFKLLSNSSVISDTFTAAIQTPSNANKMKLIAYVVETGTSAWEIKAELRVTPSRYVFGTPITDWFSYSPVLSITLQGTGIVAPTGKWRRVGDSIEVAGSLANGNSSATGGTLTWTLPFPVDSNRQVNSVSGFRNDGTAFYNQTPVSMLLSGSVAQFINPGTADFYLGTAIAAGARLSFTGTYPASGISSSVQMSDTSDNRVIGLTARKAAAQSIPNGGAGAVITSWPAGYTDTHGSFDPTTGVYTVRSSGRFRVNGMLAWATASGGIRVVDIIKNASTVLNSNFVSASSVSSYNHEVNWEGDLVAGDTVKLNAFQNSGSALNVENLTTASGSARLTISNVSGNQTIAASDTIGALYTGGPPTGTLNGSLNLVTFTTKVKDSHSAYASGLYKIPASGQFDISAQVRMAGSYASSTGFGIAIYIDGVQAYIVPLQSAGPMTEGLATINIKSVPLISGQSVAIYAYTTATSPSYTASSAGNFFSITRSGNF